MQLVGVTYTVVSTTSIELSWNKPFDKTKKKNRKDNKKNKNKNNLKFATRRFGTLLASLTHAGG